MGLLDKAKKISEEDRRLEEKKRPEERPREVVEKRLGVIEERPREVVEKKPEVVEKRVEVVEKKPEVVEKRVEVVEKKEKPKAITKPRVIPPFIREISKAIDTIISSQALAPIRPIQEILISVKRAVFNFIYSIKSILLGIQKAVFTILNLIKSILLGIQKAIFTIVSLIKNNISRILIVIYRFLIIIRRMVALGPKQMLDAIIKVPKWTFTAIFGLLKVILDVVKGAQDRVIAGATTKTKHLTPKSLMDTVEDMAVHGSVSKTSSQIIATTTIYSFIFSILVGSITYSLNFSGILVFLSFIGGFVLVFVIAYIILNILADRRGTAVDAVLPDVLQIVSVNMIAGMTPYNSLLVAARPEFGPLAEEIHKAVQDTMSGKPLADSLRDISKRVRSDKLKRCINLMVQGMESGGDLSKVLQGIAKDIRYVQSLQKEMKSNTTAYSMFILFAILIGTPLLLGVSITFVEVFSAIFATIDVGSMEGMGQTSMISLEGLSITPEFFNMYAIFVLMISGFFGGIMIGVIQTGKASSGITMGPVLAIVAIVIFMVLHAVLFSVFGGAISGV